MAVPMIAWVLGSLALGAAGVAVAMGREVEAEGDPADYDAFEVFAMQVTNTGGDASEPERTGGDAEPDDPNAPQVRKKKGKAQAAKVQPKAIPTEWSTRSAVITTFGKFDCDRGKDLDVPKVPIPPQILAFGGPIVQGAVAGIDAFFAGLKKMGNKDVCTVKGGYEFIVLDVRPYASARVNLELSWTRRAGDGNPPHYPVRVIRFAGERGSTGEIPAVEVDDTPWSAVGKPVNQVAPNDAEYLRTGFPLSGNAAKWYPPPGPAQPKVELLRTDDDLTLVLWLPARGGSPVDWLAEWTMRPA